jgi:hypothetical protein
MPRAIKNPTRKPEPPPTAVPHRTDPICAQVNSGKNVIPVMAEKPPNTTIPASVHTRSRP